MSAQHKPFKISDLPKISNISDNDLLLVSDYDAGKCTSKQMALKQIASYLAAKLQPTIQQLVEDALDDSLDELIEQKVNEAVQSLDIEPEVVKVLDRMDGVEDNVIDVKGGNSN